MNKLDDLSKIAADILIPFLETMISEETINHCSSKKTKWQRIECVYCKLDDANP